MAQRALQPFNKRYHVSREGRQAAFMNYGVSSESDDIDYSSLIGAFTQADMNFGVENRELFFKDSDGLFQPWPGRTGLVRAKTQDDPIERPMSIVSKRYKAFQNDQFAQVFEPFATNPHMKLVAIGSVKNGMFNFAIFEVGEVVFNGEVHKQYLLITHWHKPGTSVKLCFITIRSWCTNQFMRLMNSGLSLKLHHNPSLVSRAEAVTATLQSLDNYSNDLFDQYRRLQAMPCDDVRAESIFRQLAQKIHPANLPLMNRITDDLMNVYNVEGRDGTDYGVLMSITAMANHMKGKMVKQQLLIPDSSRNEFMRQGWKICTGSTEQAE